MRFTRCLRLSVSGLEELGFSPLFLNDHNNQKKKQSPQKCSNQILKTDRKRIKAQIEIDVKQL